MKRKVLLLAAVLVIWAQGVAAQDNKWDIGTPNAVNITATLDNGTLTISGSGRMGFGSGGYPPWYNYRSSIDSVFIDNNVTSIESRAFYGCTGLTAISIPASVTSIGNSAFWGCTGLKSITIPTRVTSIGDEAFYGCAGLTTISIPASVTSIGGGAFQGCTDLKSVSIPAGVTSIEAGTFSGCAGLTAVSIPTSVTSIESNAFYGCTGLTSITIPGNVTTIRNSAFDGCTGLMSISLSSVNANYSTDNNGVLFDKNKTALIRYPAGKSGAYSIPTGVASIGHNAFHGCTGLTNITIPDSVAVIGYNAFLGCAELTSITVAPDNANYSAENGVLFNKDKTKLIHYPAKKQGGYYIPEGVTSIGDAFLGCTGLKSIMIPGSVTSIGNKAFEGCTSLNSIIVAPDNVNYSDENGVLFNKYKTKLIRYPAKKQGTYFIPSSVTSIESCAFMGCADLPFLLIPSSVVSIGNDVFLGCAGLTDIGVESANANYSAENGVLFNKNKTRLIHFPAKKQGEYYIPGSVIYIENGAFWGCAGLKSIFSLNPIPPSVSSNVFDDLIKTTVCLYVTQNSAKSYGSANEWKDFTCITPIQTVTFDSRAGSAVSSQVVENGAGVSNPADPVRAGYAFDGWYNDTKYTVEWNFKTGVVTSDTTLYAKWLQVYSVTFSSLGGGSVSTQDVTRGNKAEKPDVPERAKFILGGWYQDMLYNIEWYFDTDIVTSDMTLYAKWVPVFVVTFDSQNGDVNQTLTVTLGDKAKKPDNPINPNRLFAGWYKDAEYAGVWNFDTDIITSDTTLYAKWTGTASVLSHDRAIPPSEPKKESGANASAGVLTGELTAGPNPVYKSAGKVNLFWQGKGIENATLSIYDASGNFVQKIKIRDETIGKSERRPVGLWDLKDVKGRSVSEGTYIVKGKIATRDGESERVSLMLGVR